MTIIRATRVSCAAEPPASSTQATGTSAVAFAPDKPLSSNLRSTVLAWRSAAHGGSAALWQGSPLTTHLALYAFVEARHTDDHALVDAAADGLDLVARFHAERDGAAFHAQNRSGHARQFGCFHERNHDGATSRRCLRNPHRHLIPVGCYGL